LPALSTSPPIPSISIFCWNVALYVSVADQRL
jgi:hypothetical protein